MDRTTINNGSGLVLKGRRLCWSQRLLLRRLQFPELAVASYNKNTSAPNDPDGIVAVWNLHLIERPEFVFHASVRALLLTLAELTCVVRRHLSHLLPLPSHPYLWRLLLWSDPPLGHTSEAAASPQDAFIRNGTHLPDLCDEDGRYAECEQSHIKQYRWDDMQLAGGYACSTPGPRSVRFRQEADEQ